MSKTSPILRLIREFQGGRSHSNSRANDHVLYIERDGASEQLGLRKRYDGTDGWLDNIDAMEELVAERTAKELQDYLESASAAEKLPLRNIQDDEIDVLKSASFGTLGATIEERHHFWQEVEKLEADPRGDKVQLRIEHNQKIWDNVLANLKTAPEPLQKELAAHAAEHAPDTITLKRVPTAEAFAIYKWAHGIGPAFPIDIEPGRGGRVQNRIIAELPHELDSHERVTIVRNFAEMLVEKGLPYWAVIHAPNENNDSRNYHVHIVYYDRPAAKMADPKDPSKLVWDFEVVERKRFSNRHLREVRPHLQSKDRDVSAQGWVKDLRRHWEKVSNDTMAYAGLRKRYDARTYEEMGINLDPLKHIPSKTFNRERKGELTTDGVALARRQWDVLIQKVVKENYSQTALRRRNIARNAERVGRLLGRMNPAKALSTEEVQRIAKIADKCAISLGMAELCQDVSRVVIDRVASRARLVFYAAFGDVGKKPRGRPRKYPQPLPPPSKFLPAEAEEARLFLKTVLPAGRRLDERNRKDLLQARERLAVMSRRLEQLERNPRQHPRDRRQPGYVDPDWFDPTPEEIARSREEARERLQESIMALAESGLAEVLKATVDEAMPSTNVNMAPDPVPAPTPPSPIIPTSAAEPSPPREPTPAIPVAPTAPTVPAHGPGSRPAYLDDMNPKGTKYRYEPFSYRPDRPQRSVVKSPTQPVPDPAIVAKPVSKPAVAQKINSASRPVAAPLAPALQPRKPAPPAPSPDAPVQEERVVPTPALAARPASQNRALPPAVKPAPTQESQPPSAQLTAAPAKPVPTGSILFTRPPKRSLPERISGLVIEGTNPPPPQALQSEQTLPPPPPVVENTPTVENWLTTPDQGQIPTLVEVPPVPKKHPIKKGRRWGSSRDDSGYER
ncbi:MobA/MobL family protein [Boseaceae bacterium BT-24-1]|nr:MobA/MobL family protein [Boseaceae bacterium BT-24-1]